MNLGEGQGGGFSAPSASCFVDHMDDALQFTKHLIIRKSKNDIAFALEPRVALLIARPTGFKVVTLAIEFDDHARGMTNDIGDVVSQRDLPPESKTFDPMRLDAAPQQDLGAGHSLPKFFCPASMPIAHGRMRHVSDPPP